MTDEELIICDVIVPSIDEWDIETLRKMYKAVRMDCIGLVGKIDIRTEMIDILAEYINTHVPPDQEVKNLLACARQARDT